MANETSNSEKIIQRIISKVKEKPELSGLADSVISDALEKCMRKNNLEKKNLENLRDSDIKLIVKDVRSALRLSAGQFHSLSYQMENLQDNLPELLKAHSSTSERMEFYPKIKELLKELKIKSVLDLGCGLNPIELAKSLEKYYALDINESEIKIINSFFRKNNIEGKAFVYDLRKINKNDIPEADICLIFKVFDVLEKRGHKLAERILCSVKAKYFLISFSTKTLSGKAMNHPQRGWIELLLKRLGFDFKIIKSNNEIFYLAQKSGL